MTGSARRGTRARPSMASNVMVGAGTMRSTLEPLGQPETIAAFFRRAATRFADRRLLGERKNGRRRDTSWGDFRTEVTALACFLRSRGVLPGDRVAVYSPNRGEMLAAELATMSIGAVHTPIFAGYPATQACELFAHAGAVALLVPDLERLAGAVLPEGIRLVVTFDRATPPGSPPPTYEGELCTYETALHVGERHGAAGEGEKLLLAGEARDVDEPCLLMYTSGTSGEPKGVLLSHDNILSQQRALARLWSITPDDAFLSYLPWHHSFGGIFEKYTALYNGARYVIDESRGKTFDTLLSNWMEIRPTVYFSVPKVYQELVNHVRTHPADEARVFHDGLSFVFTAAAPLPENISSFFARRGIPVVEGWGLTETSPCCTLTDPAEERSVPGVVGYPIPGVSLKLSPEGEILVRGRNVMLGYHRDPESTAQSLRDGWFHTGDLGELLEEGLRLVSRRDRVFKMLNAEKVVPTGIENALAGSCRYIQHAVVVGSGRDFLAALIFPDYFLIEREFGEDRERADRVVRHAFRDAVTKLNREQKIRYEHVQAFAVVARELSVEGGELTPSMKVRVQNVLKGQQPYLEAIYDPSRDCDCCFLRKVMRLQPDDRRCFRGRDVTLDRCHECGLLIFEDTDEEAASPRKTPSPARKPE